MTVLTIRDNKKIAAPVALAICLAGLSQTHLLAADKRIPRDDYLRFSAFSDTIIAELSEPEFDDRWSRPPDYILTPAGAVISSHATLARESIDDNASQSDDILSSANNGFPFIPRNEDINHIGNISPHGNADEGLAVVPECGPSPLSPDDIRALVTETAKRRKVDPALAVAVASVESNLDRNRNSVDGARGPMQLMPATVARFNVTDPCDPAENIDGGVRYLRALLDEFQNPMLAIAAYNAGPQRIYEHGGIPPFAETVRYVTKILNHQFGLSPPYRNEDLAETTRGTIGRRSNRGVIVPKERGKWIAGVMQF